MKQLQVGALLVGAIATWLSWRVLRGAGLEPATAALLAGGAAILAPMIVAALLVSVLFVTPKDSRGRAQRRAVTLTLLILLQGAVGYGSYRYTPETQPVEPQAVLPEMRQVEPQAVSPAIQAQPVSAPPSAQVALIERSYWGEVSGLAEARAAEGTLYVSGTLSQSARFGGAALRGCIEVDNCHVAFVAKYGPSRALEWVRLIHHASLAETALRATAEGGVIALLSASARSEVETGPEEMDVGRARSPDDHPSQLILVRYHGDGTLQWRAQLASATQAGAGGLDLTPNGDALVWASFSKRMGFYRGDEMAQVDGVPIDHPGQRTWPGDTAIFRINPRGEVIWSKRLWSEPLNTRRAVVRPSGGLALTGNLSDPSNAKKSGTVFIAWVDGSGVATRMRYAVGEAPLRPNAGAPVDIGFGQAYPVELAAHADGTLVVAGYFGGSLVVGSEHRTLTSAGMLDLWVASFADDGSLRFADSAGSPGLDVSLLSHGLKINDDAIEVWGNLDYPVTFGRGTPNETVLPRGEGTERNVHAVWARNGTFRRADRAAAPAQEAVVTCCNRESNLTVRARKKPWPAPDITPNAPQISAWVRSVLGGVELGWTLEGEVEAQLPQPAPRHQDAVGGGWGWELKAPVPGTSDETRAELVAVHGVAFELKLFFEKGRAPRRDDLRRFFGALHQVATTTFEGPTDVFCPVSGTRASTLVAVYDVSGEAKSLTLAGRSGSCAPDEELRRNQQFIEQMRQLRGRQPPK